MTGQPPVTSKEPHPPVLQVLAAQRREHLLVEKLGEHDGRERSPGFVGVAQSACGEVLVVELEAAADVLAA
jgi:hypothetical protein